MKEWQLLPATACHDKWEYVNHRWCTCHVCTPHPVIAEHLYVPTEVVCSSDRHVGSVFSLLLKHLYGWCVLLCSSNRYIRSVYYTSAVAAHIWQMSHFAIFQQQTRKVCLYCPSLHLDNVFLNAAVATSSSSRIENLKPDILGALLYWTTRQFSESLNIVPEMINYCEVLFFAYDDINA